MVSSFVLTCHPPATYEPPERVPDVEPCSESSRTTAASTLFERNATRGKRGLTSRAIRRIIERQTSARPDFLGVKPRTILIWACRKLAAGRLDLASSSPVRHASVLRDQTAQDQPRGCAPREGLCGDHKVPRRDDDDSALIWAPHPLSFPPREFIAPNNPPSNLASCPRAVRGRCA